MTFDCTTLKPGDICVTRDGRVAEYIGASQAGCGNKNNHVFMCDNSAYVTNDGGQVAASYMASSFDILRRKPVKRMFDAYINVYPDDNSRAPGYVHKSAKDAHLNAPGRDRIACIHICQEYEEGEGL